MRFSKKIRSLSFLLLLALMLSLLASVVGCTPTDEEDEEEPKKEEGSSSYLDKIITPEYKDYDRDTVIFTDIVYSRPDISAMITLAQSVTDAVSANTLPYSEQLEMVKELDESAGRLLTMRSLCAIYVARDSSIEFWNEENLYILTNYPQFTMKTEALLVACAKSAHAEAFEDDFFGDGLIEKYKDGPKLTEEIITLKDDEAELMASYDALSTSSITITYNGTTDTADKILAYYKSKYGDKSTEYTSISTVVLQLYEEAYNAEAKAILIELLKVRNLIASEAGKDNYIDYIYGERDVDYTSEDISNFLADISTYVLPVYIQLYSYVFYYYFLENDVPSVTFDEVINNTYKTVKDMDEEFADVFSFMLQYKLFDIQKKSENRQSGAFTTYLNAYEAPFIFISGNENILDYSTLIHEFGHFVDMYNNDGSISSVDVSEIFSQGLELLSLSSMSKIIGEQHKTYLTYSALNNALEALVYQAFYARIEEGMYTLPYNKINEEAINGIIVSATEEFMINSSVIYKIEHVMIPHFFHSPVYVHSYCTSVVPALEIFFLEDENIGKGFEAYKKMLNRGGEDIPFLELIELAELTSPFEDGHLMDIADKIHYEIIGSHYYQNVTPSQPAA